MEGAIILMRAVEQDKSVLLITVDMTDWQANKQYIEEFIDSFKK
ncbi:MAG: hypothetical protein P8P77_04475 [Crocinitomicaceae bacterium]|jgi:hypothetical protein|nr:hypothetical protein [Crocinitomicaceae bacterium]